MTTEPQTPEPQPPNQGVRASNAEREAFAATISTASEEGRITVTEADERLTRIYAATFREELPQIVADLPKESWPVNYRQHGSTQSTWSTRSMSSTLTGRVGNEWSAALTAHIVFVGVIACGAIGAWVHSRVPFFWPAFPMFWLGLSVFVHYKIRQRWLAGRIGRRYRTD
jgi:hypothetical protein